MSASPARALLLCAGLAALLAAPQATAQADEAPSERALYVLLRGAVSGVEGDLGTTFEDTGSGLGAEAGVRLDRRWAVAVAWWTQDLPSLTEGYRFSRLDNGQPRNNGQGSRAYQGQALVRFHPTSWVVAGRPVSPFVEAGLAVVSGQGTEDERNRPGPRDTIRGYGPLGGLGVDIALTPRLGLHTSLQSTVVVPDAALDGSDPSAFSDQPSPPDGALADNIDYDVLTNASLGVRYTIPWRARAGGARVPAPRAPTPPVTPAPPTPPALADPASPASGPPPAVAPRILSLSCPTELDLNEEGAFSADTPPEAAVAWDWGDGSVSEDGAHAFDQPGTYTVTATATTEVGSASDTCLVTITYGLAPPTLAECLVTPATTNVGKAVAVSARATLADEVAVDFGDGASATRLPARHDYDTAGSFPITITALNDAGTDTCTAEVTVGDPVCAAPALPGPISFKSGASDLTTGAMSALDGVPGLFERCSDLCLALEGWAEAGDGDRALSQQRADAVMFYLIGQGVEADRLRSAGRGLEPAAEPRGQGRRVDVVARSCAGF